VLHSDELTSLLDHRKATPMNTLTLARAKRTGGDGYVDPVTISITGNAEPSKAPNWETIDRGFYGCEAAMLLDALLSALPGGTIDALLVALLDYKRSLLVVGHERRTKVVRGVEAVVADPPWSEFPAAMLAKTGGAGRDLVGAVAAIAAAEDVPALAGAVRRLGMIANVLERVDERCLEADGPVTKTSREITDDELRSIYQLAIGEKP
jgi:hypothetical protein